MARTVGSANVVSFKKRRSIKTTKSAEIKHLARTTGDSALVQFRSLLRHQRNYLNWLESRHFELSSAKSELTTLKKDRSRGPKDSTYRKYRWYAESMVLLEAINGFEVFYKSSLISLAKAIRNYVAVERISGAVDAKILWGVQKASVPELIFEHQLYHDLDNIDKVCGTLIDARRYNKNSPQTQLKELNLSLQAIFQIRHTLSHNHGLITTSDRSKLLVWGYDAITQEVIDPAADYLGESVTRVMEQEAKDFTDWLVDKTAAYLQKQHTARGIELSERTKKRIQKFIGTSKDLEKLPWASSSRERESV